MAAFAIDLQAVNTAAMALLGLNRSPQEEASFDRNCGRYRALSESSTQDKKLKTKFEQRQHIGTSLSFKKRNSAAVEDDHVQLHHKRRRTTPNKGEVRDEAPAQKVKFEDPSTGKLDVKFFTYDGVGEDEAPGVWWSLEEVENIHRRERTLFTIMSCCCSFYMQHLERVLSVAWEETNGMLEDDDANDASVWIADSPSKGLEKLFVKRIRQDHSNSVITKVLELQKQLKTLPMPGVEFKETSGQHSRYLCDLYQTLSRPYARFSHLVAYGDAQIADYDHDDNTF